jgi:flagellar hook-basal body complex protein FliE
MEASSTGALKAYADALKRVQGMEGGKTDGLSSTSGAEGSSFSDMVKGVVDNVIEQSQASEKASMNAVAGGGDPLDVVTAITSAEVTLQTVVAVRDKMIQAYQEIIRMPI